MEPPLRIKCEASYAGGLDQIFVLEIYEYKTGKLMQNFTNHAKPDFVIPKQVFRSKLKSVRFEIYSSNERGISEKVIFNDIRIGNGKAAGGQKRTKSTSTTAISSSTRLSTDSMIMLLCGLAVAVLIVSTLLVIFVRRRQVSICTYS